MGARPSTRIANWGAAGIERSYVCAAQLFGGGGADIFRVGRHHLRLRRRVDERRLWWPADDLLRAVALDDHDLQAGLPQKPVPPSSRRT
jgi:hypothetical protein